MPRNTDLRHSLLAEWHNQHPLQQKQNQSRNISKHDLFASYTRALREKRYDVAERLLERYRSKCKDENDQIGLLDLQTDLQMKLNKPDLALENSKKMIRLAKDDGRGYLRAAQALQSKSDIRNALKYVNHGLKNTSRRHGSCAKLSALASHLKEILLSNIVLERANDRIPSLPPELLDMIFSYLDFRECTIILRVSKLWQQRILSSEIMSNVIDFRHSRCKVSLSCVRAAFRRANTYRKKLYIHHLNGPAWRYVNTEFGKWYQWSSLEVLDVDASEIALPSHFFAKVCRLKVIRLPNLLKAQTPFDILLDCQNLETAVIPCHAGPRVTTTTVKIERCKLKHLTFTTSTTYDSFSQILNFYSFPNLEHLALLRDSHARSNSVFDLTIYPKLDSLVIQSAALDGAWKTPPSLRALHFLARNFFQLTTEDLPGTNIEILCLQEKHSMEVLNHLILNGLGNHCLRELTLQNVGDLSDNFEDVLQQGLRGNAVVFANVETLKLYQENLCDKDSGLLLRLFPRLRNIEVHSPKITNLFFSDVIRHESMASQLKVVSLKECCGVEKDLVPWAKAKGVMVSITPIGKQVE